MKLKLIIFILLIQNSLFSQNYVPTEYHKYINTLVAALSNNDVVTVSKMIDYPLSRGNLLPSVKNEEEFIVRYSQIFDKKIVNEIVNSSIQTGWYNRMYREYFYIKSDAIRMRYDGKIYNVDLSDEEKEIRKTLIEWQKTQLHHSLRSLNTPLLVCITNKFKIRIDYLGDTYRYAIWPKNKNQSEKPDLILTNGEYVPDGSGGNYYYEFINNKYKYRLYIWIIRHEDMPPGALHVYKDDELILEQEIIKFIK